MSEAVFHGEGRDFCPRFANLEKPNEYILVGKDAKNLGFFSSIEIIRNDIHDEECGMKIVPASDFLDKQHNAVPDVYMR